MIGMIHLHSRHVPAEPAELVDIIPGRHPDSNATVALVLLRVGEEKKSVAYCLPFTQLADLIIKSAHCTAMQEIMAEALKPKVNPENN